MDASIDRALNYYVSKYGDTAPNNLDKAVNFIYDNVSFTIDDNVTDDDILNMFLMMVLLMMKTHDI